MSKSTAKIVIVALVVLFFALALLFRVALPYDSIFTGEWVKLSSNDAYYHVRFVDSLAYNFPHVTDFDPFYIYPGGGTSAGGVHFFEYLMAFIAWVIGFGSPTQHTIDLVSTFLPSILAALTVIPVFFIGKALFNRWAGLLAAFLVGIMPGEFMGRSILGSSDVPPAETLFSTVTILFLILAFQAAGAIGEGQNPLTFEQLRKGDRKALARPLVYSLLAGLFLGIYLITWMGALLFVFIICLYLLIQFIINHFRQKSSEHLGIVSFIVFVVALIIFLPISPNKNLSLAMTAAVFVPLVLTGFSRLMLGRGLKSYYYPLSLVAIGVVVIGLFYAVGRDTVSALWNNFLFVFAPGGGSTATTTQEMQPLLSPYGSFTTTLAWGNFTTGFFLTKNWAIPGFGLIALVVLLWQVIKAHGQKELILLFIVWSLVTLFATLVQRRFAYYSVVNVALLTAFISWEIIWWAGLKKLAEKQAGSPGEDKAESAGARKKRRQESDNSRYVAYTIIAIIIVLPLVTFWNVTKSKDAASAAPYAPSDGWEESLTWMKNNTPDPLGDPGAYYKVYDLDYEYPASAYGVTAWWDYGYWISRIAHRLPSTNPSQDPVPIIKVANLFLSQEEAAADKIMDELDSSYIIIDFDMVNAWSGKFHALATWADKDQDKYINVYYTEEQGIIKPWKIFLNTDYYNCLVVRLFNFDGQETTGEKPIVLTYNETVKGGVRYKIVTAAKQYNNYGEAQNFIASQTSGKYDIVGGNPFVSPVPLEALSDYKMVYTSRYYVPYAENATAPEIKIFEYLK
jgi:oligosaccharyl transferase (archaeosortase A-associated)